MRDKAQQQPVAVGIRHVGLVALHRNHAQRPPVAHQRHAQPGIGTGPGRLENTLGDELIGLGPAHQQRLAGAQHVFGQPRAHAPADALATLLVHVVGKFQRLPVFRHQGDVAVAGVDELTHRVVHSAVEVVHAAHVVGALGNAVQGGLQPLATLAAGHLGHQGLIGPGQLGGADLHGLLQGLLALLALHGGEHVAGHKLQQRLFFGAVAIGLVVALHHQGAAHVAALAQGHAQPVLRMGTTRPQGAGHLLRQRLHGAAPGQAVAHQVPGQRLGVVGHGDALAALGLVRGGFVHHVDEVQAVAGLVVQRHEQVARVHERAHDGVQLLQHVGHFQVGAGQL